MKNRMFEGASAVVVIMSAVYQPKEGYDKIIEALGEPTICLCWKNEPTYLLMEVPDEPSQFYPICPAYELIYLLDGNTEHHFDAVMQKLADAVKRGVNMPCLDMYYVYEDGSVECHTSILPKDDLTVVKEEPLPSKSAKPKTKKPVVRKLKK